ncbi:RNA polymerase sigma factor [Nymphaea thermarum]|nr:RNA polymerase sigma factor [Nymphaea thermarum]
MRKVFGWEPTRGELSKVLGSEISAMQSSLKRGWYSRHTLLGSFMGLIRSIASKHQGRGIAIEDHVQASKDPVSLDQPFRRGSYTTHKHLIPDEEAETATEMFMRELLCEEMTKLIGSISPREAEVWRYRYGFQNCRTMTVDEIGSIIKVSKQRIGQSESSALDKLKQYGGLHGLSIFFIRTVFEMGYFLYEMGTHLLVLQ